MNASSEPQADTAGPLTPSSRGATDTCTPTTGDTDGMLTTNTCSTAPPQSPYDPFEPATGKPQTPGPQEPSVPGVRPRLTYLDLTRGLIMVVMCWDHVKDLVHQGGGGPEPPEMWYAPPKWTAFPAVFFWLRWVSHFCAPGFFYTMGMGMTLFCAARLRRGWTMARICRHYATRAAVLFLVGRISDFGFGAENLVDVVEGWKVVGWISGNVHGKVSLGEALWQLLFGVYQVMTGLSMAMFAMALLIPCFAWLQRSAGPIGQRMAVGLPAALGVACFALSNVVIVRSQHGAPAAVRDELAHGFVPMLMRFLILPGRLPGNAITVYPLIPWVGFTLVGFTCGSALDQPLPAQRRQGLAFAVLCACLFCGFRVFGGVIGNYRGWPRGETIPGLSRALDFWNVCKYPPSPTYALLTLATNNLLMVLFSFVALEEQGRDVQADCTCAPDSGCDGDCECPDDRRGADTQPSRTRQLVAFGVRWALTTLRSYGSTPLLFYILHVWFACSIGAVVRMTHRYGISWSWTIVAWVGVLLLLKPICVRYGQFKGNTSPESLWRLL